jgi:hypothetical protein
LVGTQGYPCLTEARAVLQRSAREEVLDQLQQERTALGEV